MSEFLDAALSYAAHGWRVFPLRPCSKEPATAHGFKDATTDAETIRAWWEKEPNDNVAIATGGGLCVIDIDDKPNALVQGSDSLREWEIEHGDLTPTVTAITGSGGTHYFYDVGAAYIPCSASAKIAIDIRCDGGYVVAPPSIHPNGNRYVWDISPDDMDVCKVGAVEKACIQWIHDSASGSNGKRDTSIPSNPIREGEGRNNWLYAQGASARGKGADDDTVRIFLEALNVKKCAPPLPAHELNRTIESVCKLPVGMSDEAKETVAKAEKKKSGKPRKFQHNKVAKTLIDDYGACLIDGETPALCKDGRYRVGWEMFDSLIIDMHDDCTMTNRREVKAYIQAKAPIKRQSSPYLIAFENGVLDVRTLELRDWRKDDIIPNVIPHNWNPNAKSATLDRVIEKMACGDIATMFNLSEFIGVCMIRSAKLCPFFPVLIGVGSNGKSTYIELLKEVIGMENISGLQPKEIAAHFLASHIVGKTANLGDDISSGYLDDKDCAVIKSIATGDLMFTDVKGGKGFHFQPYCTMVFSCNQFPRLADTTPGFMRRLFPIEFNAVFSASDPDYDPMIGEKLREEETLEYACVIGVEGLRRILENNCPTPNEMSETMKSEIAREGNTGLQWFNDDGITAEHLIGMTKEEAHKEYLGWCERNGYTRTAMGSGAISALIGTYYRLKCTKIDHRDYVEGRKTVKVYELKVPAGAANKSR